MIEGAAPTFEAALDAHGPRVLRICRRILGDAHLGDDAAQEAFLRLWRALLSGEGPRAPGGWLVRAAASAAIDSLRRRRLLPRSASDVGDADEAAALDAPDPRSDAPDAAAASADLAAKVEREVASLPAAQRTVFVLRHDATLPLSEVAPLLGVGLPTVKTHYARAVLRIRAAVSDVAAPGARP
jgi:RNA polymerase sigma-70 factor (ECF subfamily)